MTVDDRSSELFIAVLNGDYQAVEELLDAGVNIDARHCTEWITPLHCALLFGFDDVAQLLLARGADINAPYANGSLPHKYIECLLGKEEFAKLRAEREARRRLKAGRTTKFGKLKLIRHDG